MGRDKYVSKRRSPRLAVADRSEQKPKRSPTCKKLEQERIVTIRKQSYEKKFGPSPLRNCLTASAPRTKKRAEIISYSNSPLPSSSKRDYGTPVTTTSSCSLQEGYKLHVAAASNNENMGNVLPQDEESLKDNSGTIIPPKQLFTAPTSPMSPLHDHPYATPRESPTVFPFSTPIAEYCVDDIERLSPNSVGTPEAVLSGMLDDDAVCVLSPRAGMRARMQTECNTEEFSCGNICTGSPMISNIIHDGLQKVDQKMKEKRIKAKAEVLSTEETYITTLHWFVGYGKALEHDIMFSEYRKLFEPHSSLINDQERLRDQLKAALEEDPDADIVSVLADWLSADIAKKYYLILEGQDINRARMGELAELPAAKRYYEKIVKERGTFTGVSARLADLMVTPWQRITRYPMMIENILSKIPQYSDEYVATTLALEKFQRQTHELNVKTGEKERQRDMMMCAGCCKFPSSDDALANATFDNDADRLAKLISLGSGFFCDPKRQLRMRYNNLTAEMQYPFKFAKEVNGVMEDHVELRVRSGIVLNFLFFNDYLLVCLPAFSDSSDQDPRSLVVYALHLHKIFSLRQQDASNVFILHPQVSFLINYGGPGKSIRDLQVFVSEVDRCIQSSYKGNEQLRAERPVFMAADESDRCGGWPQVVEPVKSSLDNNFTVSNNENTSDAVAQLLNSREYQEFQKKKLEAEKHSGRKLMESAQKVFSPGTLRRGIKKVSEMTPSRRRIRQLVGGPDSPLKVTENPLFSPISGFSTPSRFTASTPSSTPARK